MHKGGRVHRGTIRHTHIARSCQKSLTLLHMFYHGGNRNQQNGCVTDVDSGFFLCDSSTLMWLSSTLMLALKTFFSSMSSLGTGTLFFLIFLFPNSFILP